jgi:hypothetical protein
VVAADLPALGRSVHETIGGLDGVRGLRTRLAITSPSTGRAATGGDSALLLSDGRAHAPAAHGRPTTCLPTPAICCASGTSPRTAWRRAAWCCAPARQAGVTPTTPGPTSPD